MYLSLRLVVLAQIYQRFCMWPWIPSGDVAVMFYPLRCTSFCDKNGDLVHNHRFLLYTKHKAVDNILGQRFLKEFKATCKNSCESERKQQNAIWNALDIRSVRTSSCEPCRLGWLGFRDLASPLFSLQKFWCVHMRRRAGPVTEILVFATEISVTELEIYPIRALQPWYRDCPGRNIFNCAWLVRSLTSRNAVPQVFWGRFGHFSSR